MKSLAEMKAELAALQAELAALEKPKTRKARDARFGHEIEVEEGTPRCCDPSSELYWSM